MKNITYRVLTLKDGHKYLVASAPYYIGDYIRIGGKAVRATEQNCSKQAFERIMATTNEEIGLPLFMEM